MFTLTSSITKAAKSSIDKAIKERVNKNLDETLENHLRSITKNYTATLVNVVRDEVFNKMHPYLEGRHKNLVMECVKNHMKSEEFMADIVDRLNKLQVRK